MREILFRGKGRDTGKWFEGYYYSVPAPLVCFTEDTEEVSDEHYITFENPHYVPDWNMPRQMVRAYVLPETVGQYTGLLDKNGKMIFEGDIVRCRHNWRLQVYPNDGIDAEKCFFEQKIRGAYGKYKYEAFDSWCGEEYFYFRNYAVEYYAPNGGFRVRNGGQFHALTSNYIINRDLEIIGNIHDNPELLKGATYEQRKAD